ncbi:FtsW/RodA/SpoVE family cell cycle protein [bacterium]|nr:FtsW/RodA/SpoVE family cell cycle protein [bacterium]
MFRRNEESKLTSWYFEIDRRLLGGVLLLVFIGMLFMVSAGSVAAERIGQPWHFFIVKAMPFYAIGIITMFAVSMLNKKWILRIAWLNVAVGLALLPVTIVAPHVIKGSKRFVHLPGINVMPADIMKPGFIILTAWFLSRMHDKFGDRMFTSRDAWKLQPFSWWSYMVVFLPSLLIIFGHPDVGTAMLYLAVIGCMLFIAGLPWKFFAAIVAMIPVGITTAFFTMGHVHRRIMTLITGDGDNYQVTQSVQSIQHGGLLGSGDDAFVKQSLPDAHTDFIFAAIAEDVGAILACGLLLLLLFVLQRLVTDAVGARDRFVFYVAGGAAALFGTQVCINLMTTLHLFAPKGMTLPFISYGGSSFVAFCLLFGMVMALVREDKWK